MRLGQTVGVLTAAVFLGAGCGDSADGDGEADRTLDGTWTVIEIDGQPIVPGENTETSPFLEIEAGKAVGSFGCDGGSASLRVDGDALDVVESGSEDEGCASVAVSFAQNAIIEVLIADRVGLTLEDGRMVWVAAGRQIVLTAETAPPP